MREVAATEDAGRVADSVANATHDLYRQYGKQIYAYCLHQLRSREEAEDAVQTTFLNAFRGLQRGTTTRFEQAWLYKIAQNVCIARRSSSGRRLRLEAPDDFEILEEVVPSGGGSAADTLELMGLDDALERMPENQRRAILLREWQGLSYREIASELNLSAGAVEMLIFRARKTLAMALEEPEAAKRTSRGKAKTGFSFGSLIAALKGLFATGAAVKMATVAVSAVAVGTSAAVHAVVHRALTHRDVRTAASPPIVRASPQAPVRTSPAVLVSWRAPRVDVARDAAPTRPGPGAKLVIVQDVSTSSTPDPPVTADPPATSTGSSPPESVSLTVPAAPATTPASSATPLVAPPPATTQAVASGADGPSGSQGSTSNSENPGSVHHGREDLGVKGKGKGHPHATGNDPFAQPPTAPTTRATSDSSDTTPTPTTDTGTTTTATTTTTTTTATTTTTTTPTTPTTPTTLTTTTAPPATITTSNGTDSGSNSSPPSSGDSGHDHGHDGGNGGGGVGADGHHGQGH